MSFRKLFIAGILSLIFLLSFPGTGNAQSIDYVVQPGDSFWLISQKHGVPLKYLMAANNATENTIIYPYQNITIPTDYGYIHTVKKGDTFWLISQKYGVSLTSLLKANNATEKTILYIGDKVYIPAKEQTTGSYTVQPGDTYWIISQKFNVDINTLMTYNGADKNTVIYPGQKVLIPSSSSNSGSNNTTEDKKPYITYTWYTVKKGDILWDIAIDFGIPFSELLSTNNLTENSYVYPGDILKIPVHHVPVKETPGEQYGEYLDWWTEAQYVLPVGSTFEIVDFYTGKSFWAKRTTGANHADCETLTLNDTNIMKEIWGGSFNWNTRPVIIKYNGRKIAASASNMPHAGNDAAPGGVHTTWRSGDYGAGYNLDWVKGNGIDGVFDVHFLNSTRHLDGKVDPNHQSNIKEAAGK
ncbi:MAG TPA: LysM peptidoglycan-binding domain-containing protein [Clostridiaceae bacterium]|nr:LysM peptidoglycan-binding domain-containing protein [Clostridiaceae bacterium]